MHRAAGIFRILYSVRRSRCSTLLCKISFPPCGPARGKLTGAFGAYFPQPLLRCSLERPGVPNAFLTYDAFHSLWVHQGGTPLGVEERLHSEKQTLLRALNRGCPCVRTALSAFSRASDAAVGRQPVSAQLLRGIGSPAVSTCWQVFGRLLNKADETVSLRGRQRPAEEGEGSQCRTLTRQWVQPQDSGSEKKPCTLGRQYHPSQPRIPRCGAASRGHLGRRPSRDQGGVSQALRSALDPCGFHSPTPEARLPLAPVPGGELTLTVGTW